MRHDFVPSPWGPQGRLLPTDEVPVELVIGESGEWEEDAAEEFIQAALEVFPGSVELPRRRA
jgi:hypothetical protein